MFLSLKGVCQSFQLRFAIPQFDISELLQTEGFTEKKKYGMMRGEMYQWEKNQVSGFAGNQGGEGEPDFQRAPLMCGCGSFSGTMNGLPMCSTAFCSRERIGLLRESCRRWTPMFRQAS